jgi:hypothetical protein
MFSMDTMTMEEEEDIPEYGSSFGKQFCDMNNPPEKIQITIERKYWHEVDPSGIYKLAHYYVKENSNHHGNLNIDGTTSRFIIQKHVFNNEIQLMENYDKIWRRNIYSFGKISDTQQYGNFLNSGILLKNELQLLQEENINLQKYFQNQVIFQKYQENEIFDLQNTIINLKQQFENEVDCHE